MLTQTICLDMVPRGDRPTVHLNQGDADFVVVIKLIAPEEDFTVVSGTTATLRGTKPDGTSYTKGASINNKIVTVSGDSNLTAAAGKGVFEICLTYRGKELYSSNFYIAVEARPV